MSIRVMLVDDHELVRQGVAKPVLSPRDRVGMDTAFPELPTDVGGEL